MKANRAEDTLRVLGVAGTREKLEALLSMGYDFDELASAPHSTPASKFFSPDVKLGIEFKPSALERTLQKRGSAWCGNCQKTLDLNSSYMVERLVLCFPCWCRIAISLGECRADLLSLTREIYAEAEE